MTDAAEQLKAGNAAAEVVRKAQSQIAYTGLAVPSSAFPRDIAQKVDSMAVGETTAPFETKSDNTLNVVKLLSKTQLPDSVEYRVIQVGGETVEAARKLADSIYTALKGGAEFETIAQKYGQQGTKQWMTSAMYQSAQTIDADTRSYLNTLNTLAAGELKNVELTQGNLILQVTDRRHMINKYDVAVVKHTIDFSKETYSAAYNKFSQFVAENKTVDLMEKNAAKFGFEINNRADLLSSEHYVVGLRATRDVMKWIFEAKTGDVSPLYECGNNDNLLVVALTKIHPAGYRDFDDVREQLKAQVVNDKKYEVLCQKVSGVSDIAAAKAKGAVVDTVRQITFAAPVFVQSTASSEPALSGAVAAVEKGKFSTHPVKGNGGVFLFQVVDRKEREGVKFDAKATEKQLQQQALQAAGRFMQELYQKAGVVDNRYLFF